MQEDDGGLQYWQQLGLAEQFESIFNDVKGNENGCNGDIKKTVSSERNIMAGWSNERQEEWRQAK